MAKLTPEQRRERRYAQNVKRAQKHTGVIPFTADGWEKVSVILMDMIEGKKPKPLYVKIRQLP